MMKLERTFYWLVALLFIVVCISFVIPQYPVVVVSFGFCILWFIWYTIVAFKSNINKKSLFISWWAINLSILIMFLSVSHSVGNYSDDPGAELGWFIAYMPVIVPIGLIPPLLPSIFDIEASLKPYIGFTTAAWLQFSIFAAIQSMLVFILIAKVKGFLNGNQT